jgi:ubiquinone biosynthesis protein UbiJ
VSTPAAAVAGLQSAVNRLLRLDPELAEGVAELEGSLLEVHIQGLDWRLQLHASRAGVEVVPVGAGEKPTTLEPDLLISGPPFTLLRLLASLESIDGVLPSDVSISGDLHLVEKLGRLAKRTDIDWEEPLSKLLGDSLTHEVGRGVRGLFSWLSKASETFAVDLGEYLREERRLSPTKLEIDDFAARVDMARDDIERLEVRISRLTGRMREL